MTLTEFLMAQIAEDKTRALKMDEHYAPFEREWEWCPRARSEPLGDLPGGPDARCQCNCPQAKLRALVECEAKRRIAELHDPESIDPCDFYDPATLHSIPCDTLRALALPYADHEDYNQGWKP